VKIFDDANFIKKLAFRRTDTESNNFADFLSIYNCKHVTFHSRKYFTLEECFKKSAYETNVKYALHFKDMGATNYDDFFVAACECGNISHLLLAEKFNHKANKSITRATIRKAFVCATNNSQIKVLEYLLTSCCSFEDQTALYLTETIFPTAVKINSAVLLEWIIKVIDKNYGNFNPQKTILKYTLILLIFEESNKEFLERIRAAGYLADYTPYQLAIQSIQSKFNFFKYVMDGISDDIGVDFRFLNCLVSQGRLDILDYVVSKKLYKLTVFELDTIIYLACLYHKKEIIKYAVTHGGKLYKLIYNHSMKRKQVDLLELLLNQKDILNYSTTPVYLQQLISLGVNDPGISYSLSTKLSIGLLSLLKKKNAGHLTQADVEKAKALIY
jgi:hypothetical protein